MTHVDAFNNAVSKAQEAYGLNGYVSALDPILYVPGATPAVCCHIEEGGLRFLCPASRDGELDPAFVSLYSSLMCLIVDPLFVFSFLHTFVATLREYLQDVSIVSLKDNFDVVYQVI